MLSEHRKYANYHARRYTLYYVRILSSRYRRICELINAISSSIFFLLCFMLDRFQDGAVLPRAWSRARRWKDDTEAVEDKLLAVPRHQSSDTKCRRKKPLFTLRHRFCFDGCGNRGVAVSSPPRSRQRRDSRRTC